MIRVIHVITYDFFGYISDNMTPTKSAFSVNGMLKKLLKKNR